MKPYISNTSVILSLLAEGDTERVGGGKGGCWWKGEGWSQDWGGGVGLGKVPLTKRKFSKIDGRVHLWTAKTVNF